jgi:hypothetical protein
MGHATGDRPRSSRACDDHLSPAPEKQRDGGHEGAIELLGDTRGGVAFAADHLTGVLKDLVLRQGIHDYRPLVLT